MLELQNVSKNYEQLPVLRDVNFQLDAGAACAIMGPSGCGKSTLLNLIGALDKPDSGSVILNGRDLSQLNENELAGVRNRDIGFVFQLHHLLPQCTTLENVLIPLLAQGNVSKDHENRAGRLLERVGLSQRLSHFPGQLSGGERQRVALVRALINQPKLLLADEPTGALDEKSSENLASLLLELNREEGVALIVVTHAPALAALLPLRYELHQGVLSQTQ
jgi:ABC-type lipoprotein export system ATPase subunit